MADDRALRDNPDIKGDDSRRRFMMVLSYDGAPFKGWQIQPSDPSVQEAVERALRIALKVPLHIVGAGRTDTAVNARHITAHFDLPANIGYALADSDQSRKRLVHTVNAILRPSVTVHHIVPVPAEAHARFDATSRTYRYYLHTVPDPFRDSRSRYFHRPLDFDLMNREAQSLLGKHDFTSFSKLHTDTKTNFCNVSKAQWVQYGPGHYYFEISADRFLRNMVRAVVGTLLDVGTGKASTGHVTEVMEAMDRCAAGTSVPGYALYLWDISYPYPLPDNPLADTL